MSREEVLHLMKHKNHGKLLYADFQKIILDFQLQEHEKFLCNFINLIRQVDRNREGIINENQFRELMTRMNIIKSEEEIYFLLGQIDPYNNNKISFSEIIQTLSTHMV